jgi:hypothetical protein
MANNGRARVICRRTGQSASGAFSVLGHQDDETFWNESPEPSSRTWAMNRGLPGVGADFFRTTTSP